MKNKSISDCIAEYKTAYEQMQLIKDTIIERIKESVGKIKPLNGVKEIKKSPPIAIVKFSTVAKHHVLSPEYYLPEVQQKTLVKYLFQEPKNGELTIKTIFNRITSCVETGYIKQMNNNRFKLNENVMKTLKSLHNELLEIIESE